MSVVMLTHLLLKRTRSNNNRIIQKMEQAFHNQLSLCSSHSNFSCCFRCVIGCTLNAYFREPHLHHSQRVRNTRVFEVFLRYFFSPVWIEVAELIQNPVVSVDDVQYELQIRSVWFRLQGKDTYYIRTSRTQNIIYYSFFS